MAIEILSGNLLDADTKYIAHQANCITSRALGLAHNIFLKWPTANIYSSRTKFHHDSPGTIKITENHTGPNIIHMFGQYGPGKPRGGQNSRTDGYQLRKQWFFQCLRAIMSIGALESIAFPYGIGCGLAGGHWGDYSAMLEFFADKVGPDTRVVVYKIDQ
jgi:O-acetyl-ADP-ribose deacetylase (regulator of RNase III)